MCSSVRSTLAALAIGASGLRSSCESIARNCALTPLGEAQLLGALGERFLELPCGRGCRRSVPTKPFARHRPPRRGARRCRASSGTRRRCGAAAGPARTAAPPRSWSRGCRRSDRRPRDGPSASSRCPAGSSRRATGVRGPGAAEPVGVAVERGAPDAGPVPHRRSHRRAGSARRSARLRDALRRSRWSGLRCAGHGRSGSRARLESRRTRRTQSNRMCPSRGGAGGAPQAARRRCGDRRRRDARPMPPSAAGGTW